MCENAQEQRCRCPSGGWFATIYLMLSASLAVGMFAAGLGVGLVARIGGM